MAPTRIIPAIFCMVSVPLRESDDGASEDQCHGKRDDAGSQGKPEHLAHSETKEDRVGYHTKRRERDSAVFLSGRGPPRKGNSTYMRRQRA